tara:strand:- start:2273 stop:2392 length:120 start_codon:yes stop_codon:yes gene_type:complete
MEVYQEVVERVVRITLASGYRMRSSRAKRMEGRSVRAWI